MLRVLVLALCITVGALVFEGSHASAAPSGGICDKVTKVAGKGGTINAGRHRKCKKDKQTSTSSTSTQTKKPTPQPKKSCLRTVTDPWCPAKKIPTRHPRPSAEQLQKVAAKLQLPDVTPRFGPDPSVNEWKMLAVGFPVWLWTDGPTTLSTTARSDGLDFSLTATWQSTTFTMGDGHSQTCTATTPYPAHIDKPGSPSPTCGYVYDTASPKAKPYTVTAEAAWRIDWSSGGEQGSFLHHYSASRPLVIGELESLVRG
jgi:hypothetical protein